MNRVYNYTLDPCGPVYITVGDGGNNEKVDVDHADDPGKCPSPGDNTLEFGGDRILNLVDLIYNCDELHMTVHLNV
ncbi:hypothetical protein RND71_025115 [Anisodus tanguticus]|uniref:Uncharacterized protein n=1 Tax=Anisodus tanguticus TaxID=243964 RepID=A0AAE1RPD2_9SOLA|nr:hypothetical protein RND71_025115 [Anisodus tanguticus]